MSEPRINDEQMAAFKRMVMPTVFDPTPIKRKFLDVQYGTLPEQKADVYLPDEGEGPFPLIIYVHGGGWSMGTKREGALPCIIDAIKYGYAVISVDYRLAPGVKFPEFLFDVKNAITMTTNRALDASTFEDTYEKAPEHIVCSGFQMLYILLDLGLKDRIAGMLSAPGTESRACYKAELVALADSVPRLGKSSEVSKEKLVALNCDFLMGWDSLFSDKNYNPECIWRRAEAHPSRCCPRLRPPERPPPPGSLP